MREKSPWALLKHAQIDDDCCLNTVCTSAQVMLSSVMSDYEYYVSNVMPMCNANIVRGDEYRRVMYLPLHRDNLTAQ